MVLPFLQPRIRQSVAPLLRGGRARPARLGRRGRHLPRARRADRVRRHEGTERIRSVAGQVVPDRVRATAGRGDARSYRERHSQDVRYRAAAARRRQRGCIPRTVDQWIRQRLQRRHRLRDSEAGGGAPRESTQRRRDRAGSERKVRRHSGGLCGHLPSAARTGPRVSGRVQTLRSRPRGNRVRRPLLTGSERDGRGTETSRAGRTFLELPGERAADRRNRRPRAGQDVRRRTDRCLRHASGLPRLTVRERFQPIRPDLSGERSG